MLCRTRSHILIFETALKTYGKRLVILHMWLPYIKVYNRDLPVLIPQFICIYSVTEHLYYSSIVPNIYSSVQHPVFWIMWSSFPIRAIFVQNLLPLQHHAQIEINQKSDSVSAPLKLMSSRMSPRASHFSKTFSLRNRQMSLKGKKCRGTSKDGVNMAHWWRILDMRIEEKGTSFQESRTSGWSLFCGLEMRSVVGLRG